VESIVKAVPTESLSLAVIVTAVIGFPYWTVCVASLLLALGATLNVTATSLEELAHTPLLIVQRNVYMPRAETATVELEAWTLPNDAVPGPLNFVHVPTPTLGAFAAKVVFVVHTDWAGPALAVVGV
jgi:hypothetical protein